MTTPAARCRPPLPESKTPKVLPSGSIVVKDVKPLWTPADGITQSMLCKFLICRHRFWIRYVLGLVPREEWNHRIEYGSMFHAGLEALAAGSDPTDGIRRYANRLLNKFPEQATDIVFWKAVCQDQFHHYINRWCATDVKRKYVMQEEPFDITLELPSGRNVRLRGKFDEVFQLQKANKTGGKIVARPVLHLQENKVKGDIDEAGIAEQLTGDLQTMLYLTALNVDEKYGINAVVRSPDYLQQIGNGSCTKIVYNVIQRPLGGKYPIRQKKSETQKQFIERIDAQISADPKAFFFRWHAEVKPADLHQFQQRTLFPILEQLLDWWDSIRANPLDPWTTTPDTDSDWWHTCKKCHLPTSWTQGDKPDSVCRCATGPNHLHYCRPFGVYDGMANGYHGDYYDYITSDGANRSGLEPALTAFSELETPSLAN